MSFARPEELHATFATAIEAADIEALLDLYEKDAITLLPDGKRITDPDARRAMFEGLLAAGVDMQGTSGEVLIAGDIALTSTAYQVPAEAGGAPTAVQTAEVSRRRPDGSWRVVIDAPTFA